MEHFLDLKISVAYATAFSVKLSTLVTGKRFSGSHFFPVELWLSKQWDLCGCFSHVLSTTTGNTENSLGWPSDWKRVREKAFTGLWVLEHRLAVQWAQTPGERRLFSTRFSLSVSQVSRNSCDVSQPSYQEWILSAFTSGTHAQTGRHTVTQRSREAKRWGGAVNCIRKEEEEEEKIENETSQHSMRRYRSKEGGRSERKTGFGRRIKTT